MNETGGSYGQSAGNVVATSRDANGWSFRPEFGGPHAAGVDQEAPAAPRAGFAPGGQPEGGRVEARYVHKIGTSSNVLVFSGSSAEGADFLRRKKRDDLTEEVVGSLNKCGREKQARALATCGKRFEVWVHPNGDRKAVPIHCDSMFCPDCAGRRGRPLIEKLRTLVNKEDRTYWFLTLTVPNVESIDRYDVGQLAKLWAKLWKSWVFQEVEDEDRKPFRIYGGVRSIECTYNRKTKSWHPHIHVLFEAPKRLPWWWLVLLKAAWIGPSGEKWYLNLKRSYSVTKRGKKIYNHLNASALKEVCKYVTKCAEFAGNHLLVDEFIRAFSNVRRIQAFGSFLGRLGKDCEREPGDEGPDAPDGEVRLRDRGYRRLPIIADISDTVLGAGGTRQFSFEFHKEIDGYIATHDPPWELTPEEPVTTEQRRIEFAGAMPEKSERQTSLFDAAA